jgi:hypothetical protein
MLRAGIRGAVLLAALALAPAGGPRARAAGKEPPPGGAAHPSAERTEEAKAALREMSDVLAKARTMRFKVRSLLPTKAPDGTWITLVGGASVLREGRDRLFVDTSGDLYPFKLYFDGKTLTAFAPEAHVFARRDASGTIDDALAQARKRGEAVFVFGDLVSADPYAQMSKGLLGAWVVGTSTVDGVETRHLAVHGKEVDWEIWIGKEDRLPRMVTITDVREARKPTQTVLITEWALDGEVPPDAFAFNPPEGTTEVPFRAPGRPAAAARRTPQPATRP